MIRSLLFRLFFCLAIMAGCQSNDKAQNPESALTAIPDSLIIDFSFAGYDTGDSDPKVIPEGYPVFNVLDFGAIPDDGKDDINAIQNAVNAAEAAGKGAVILPRGSFDFDVETSGKFVQIKSSNIHVVGCGSEVGGTELIDHHPSEYPDPDKKWLAGQYPSFFHVGKLDTESSWHPTDEPGNVAAWLSPAAKGETQVQLKRNHDVNVPGTYLLTMESLDNALTRQLTKPLPHVGRFWMDSTGYQKYKVQQMVKVLALERNTITLDAPLINDLEGRFKPKLWKIPALVSNVGIMNLRLTTQWHDEFQHHLNSIHDNGWDHINFDYCEDCWSRQNVHDGSTTAILLYSCKNCMISDSRIQGNRGHNGFVIKGASTRNLLFNLWGGTQMHTFSINNYASGNVFYNCHADQPSAIDLHGGLTQYNLFDNISGPHFEHGGGAHALPPAHTRGLVIWNWQAGLSAPYKGMIKQRLARIEEIPGFIMVGVRGIRNQPIHLTLADSVIYDTDFKNEWGINQAWQQKPEPFSLFIYQKQTRQ